DRLFSQVVVDAEDLALVAGLQHQPVQGARAGQVAPERLLDHHAREPAVVGRIDQPGALELPEERGEGAGRRGEVVEPVAPGRTGAVQRLELRSQAGKRSGLVEGAGHVAYPRREVLPD